MPIVGLGTGWYSKVTAEDIEKYTTEWLAAGGRRIDGADDYGGQAGIGMALKKSTIPRSDIFITSKVGPVFPLGYNTTIQQFEQMIVKQLQTDYVDLLLIHWPGARPHSGTPQPPPDCKKGESSWKKCRQETWKALEHLYNTGKARAIGVSNFETNHLMDIYELKSLLPAVNQIETNVYWHEQEIDRWCQARNITLNGYAPLGTPDYMKGKWHPITLNNPVVDRLAKKYNKVPAQIMLRWQIQQGIVVNPRSSNPTHMKENLDVFSWTISDEDMWALQTIGAPAPPQPPKVCPDPHTIP
eukprot:TRINITY_DN56748_c0_g1_i1.p2 TRINITY_DN56748_c0_g1~~TRINITY_DN56748_c0_g1_i1.p2  ORF type:complete len:344 (+),score=54.55 TRINITY_DN56748_c0_g1_i1:137-1033(+)